MFDMLSKVVPWPCRLLALAVLAAALVAFGWVKGAGHVQAAWDAAVVKQSLTTARVQQRQADATVQVVTKYVDRVQVVREKGADIIKEVPVYVTREADAACVLPRGFVRLHDAAAANEIPGPAGSADAAPAGITLSTAAATVADNYKRCNENAAALTALQEWVRKQETCDQ
ncbi:hypothetical protein DFQ28_005150 [Apophysomyces sp. BC1034]|nr:hypothetical protein DFQ30_010008 [Apophysomyces sp. BC1015]KAG0188258.1 hypothetical protein DFQ28_005150 [Apophysomyces sp. BC1034]